MYLFRRIRKCPACGCRRKKIKFSHEVIFPSSNQRGALVMNCLGCHALWVERPDVPWEKWALTPRAIDSLRREMEGRPPEQPLRHTPPVTPLRLP